MLTLDEHLGNCLGERHGIPAKAGARKVFQEELKLRPSLVEQAKIRVKYYDTSDGELVLKKDHVSRMHQLILKEALASNG